ncbi:MAG: hypothetical protein ACRD3O_18210 [Terriglobia bacterium]
MSSLEERFHEEMLNIYRRANDECRYNPTRFPSMVNGVGGKAAAKALLHPGSPQYGFEVLWERGRLDLTVEAVVLREPWRQLFSPDELAEIRSRLKQHGHTIPEPE